MLYLIGLGQEEGDLTLKALKAIAYSDVIFIDAYTSKIDELKGIFKGKRVRIATREFLESDEPINLARKQRVAILVRGDPLFATTHISLVLECKRQGIPFEIVHGISVFNLVARTGLSPYKFGRIVTLSGNFQSDREKIEKNISVGLHTLCLVDPRLDLKSAVQLLQNFGIGGKVILCISLGTERERIYYGELDIISEIAVGPDENFCFVIPGEMADYEEEALSELSIKP